MQNISADGYRLNVGIVLINSFKHIFIAKRLDANNKKWDCAWQMPQGGIDINETPKCAALRELREETGITSVALLAEHPEWLEYDLPIDIAMRMGKGRFLKGQRQKWFLMRFEGDESEINLLQPHQEFCQYSWVLSGQVIDKVVPFKKKVYKQVIHDFRHYLHDNCCCSFDRG